MPNRLMGKLATVVVVIIGGLMPGTLLWAQHRTGGVVRSGGPALPPIPRPFDNGFGSAVFPGTGGPPSGRIYGGSAVRPSRNNPGGGYHRGRGRGSMYTPFVYPMYWGDGFWDSGYYPPEPAAEPAPAEPAQPAPPPVIINQYFNSEPMNPAMREYRQGELPPGAVEPRADAAAPQAELQHQQFYKLAFKDGTVQLARGYSISGNTISFVTPYGSVRRVSLDQFDQEATEKLNHPAQ